MTAEGCATTGRTTGAGARTLGLQCQNGLASRIGNTRSGDGLRQRRTNRVQRDIHDVFLLAVAGEREAQCERWLIAIDVRAQALRAEVLLALDLNRHESIAALEQEVDLGLRPLGSPRPVHRRLVARGRDLLKHVLLSQGAFEFLEDPRAAQKHRRVESSECAEQSDVMEEQLEGATILIRPHWVGRLLAARHAPDKSSIDEPLDRALEFAGAGSVAHVAEDEAPVLACEAYLKRATLKRANLTGANLTRANLSEAILSEAILSEAILSEAILSEAYLKRAGLQRADLSGADLTNADLTNADLSGADLTNADLRGAIGFGGSPPA